MNNDLFLHEEVMLLALKDEEGTVGTGVQYHFAIGGAIIAELLLANKIKVDDSKKRKLVDLVDPSPTYDPLIDECLEKMRVAKKRSNLQNLVSKFANTKNIKHRVALQLCKKGILRADEDKVLLIFTRKIYPEVNPEPENKLIERLREAIFTDTPEVDSRTVVLISIAKSADLLKMAFDKKELKKRKKRIEQIINGDLAGKATQEAIQAMQAAVMVATIIPAIVVTTMSTS